MSGEVISWWMCLSAVAAFNIAAWFRSAAILRRNPARLSAEVLAASRLQLLLSAGYVFGCAFRSVLPVFDIPRIVLVDSGLSSVLVGRSVATVAELCFAGQWALVLRETAMATGARLASIASLALVPLIALAEVCSWSAVLTTSNLGHVAENSIWGLCAALVVCSVAVALPRWDETRRPLVVVWCAAGLAYVVFMFWVDVPMYWARWVADEASGRPYLGIAEGLVDVATRRVVSFSWEDWRTEVTWMSLYFSVGVWISISLIHAVGRVRVATGVRGSRSVAHRVNVRLPRADT